jgi:uncharacterized SAM-binding protein YcdF (DUF218 family)
MKRYDAILVLGTSVKKSLFKERVEKAKELYDSGVVKRIIFCGRWWGGVTKRPDTTEADAMAKYALSLGIPRSAITLEKRSMNTIGNFYFSKTILESASVKKLVIVTHQSHMPKAKFLARKILGATYFLRFYESGTIGIKGFGHCGLEQTKAHFESINDADDAAITKLLQGHPFYSHYRSF